MPRFDLRLRAESKATNQIVEQGELAGWRRSLLEYLYELAYLRLFASWESALENIFLRSLCGYSSSVGQEVLVRGSFHPTITDAEQAAFLAEQRGNVPRTYMLWHTSRQVIARLQLHIRHGPGATNSAIQLNVISSNQARLDALAAIRHRIVHDQKDAKTKFGHATLLMVGKTYTRPGRFLREFSGATPPTRRIEDFENELVGLIAQMV